MDLNLAGIRLDVTEDGYLSDLSQWNKEIAIELAKKEGIELTDKHWEVIDYIQEKYKNDEALSIRGITKSGVINIKEFYDLFPGGPLKISTLIAGIPKPKSCI